MREEKNIKLLYDYLNLIKIQGKRKKLVNDIKSSLTHFITYLGDADIREVNYRTALGFQEYLLAKSLKRISVNKIITHTGNFTGFLKRKNIIGENPFSYLKKLRQGFRLPKDIYKEHEMNLFLCELEKYYEEDNLWLKIKRYRVHVISEVMYSTGLRIREVSLLRQEDVDIENSLIRVTKTKSGKRRTVFLNEYAKGVLKRYMEKMRYWVFNDFNFKAGTLFGTAEVRLDTVVNEVLKSVSGKLKLPVIKSHGFRHAVGYHLLKAGCDIRYIKEILGHSRLRTTQVYTKVDKEDLKNMLDKFHPRKWRDTGFE